MPNKIILMPLGPEDHASGDYPEEALAEFQFCGPYGFSFLNDGRPAPGSYWVNARTPASPNRGFAELAQLFLSEVHKD